MHLTERRFGALTEAQQALVQQADLAQVEAWLDRIADGEAPAVVFRR